MLDPSNPIPSSNTSSENSPVVTEKCCHCPSMSQNFRSTTLMLRSLIILKTFATPSEAFVFDAVAIGLLTMSLGLFVIRDFNSRCLFGRRKDHARRGFDDPLPRLDFRKQFFEAGCVFCS